MNQHYIHFAIIIVLLLVVVFLYKKYTTCTTGSDAANAANNAKILECQQNVEKINKMNIELEDKLAASLKTITGLNQQVNEKQNKISLLEGTVKTLETNLDEIQGIFKTMIKTVNNNKNVVKNMTCSTESNPISSGTTHSDSACWDLCTSNKDCSYATYNGDKCNVYATKPINCSPLQGMVMYVKSLLG